MRREKFDAWVNRNIYTCSMEVKMMKQKGKNFIKIVGSAMTVCLAILFLPSVSFADNPIAQNVYTADPAPMVYDGRMYVYTSHDEDDSTYYTMNDWKCYSTTDMVNWTDHGTVMSYKNFSWAKENSAWAGQCIERDGKFYYYVPLQDTTGDTVIGVAVGDSPTGPFTDPIGKPLIKGGWGNIDPTAFVDDDGQAYLYWGNPDLRCVKLKDNMIETDGEIKEWTLTGDNLSEEHIQDMQAQFGVSNSPDRRPTLYEEGPWFYKRGDLYYMVFAGNGIPERLDYSTSTSPMGPWTYRGMIMNSSYNGKGSGSFTNHPGIADYKGHSYLFYHTGKLPGGGGFTRSVAVEEFTYNADGTFPEIPFTDEGVSALENLNPYVRTEAETLAWGNGLESETCPQGGINLCAIGNGDNLKVKDVDFGSEGAAVFTASVACGAKVNFRQGGTIELHLDSKDGTLIGTLPVSYTGGWDTYKEITTNVTNAKGVHDVYMVFRGEQKDEIFNFDYWKFTQKTSARELVALQTSIDMFKLDKTEGYNTAQMKVMAIYSDGSAEDVTSQAEITADEKDIVTVADGKVTANGYGVKADINLTVRYGGKENILNLLIKSLDAELTVKRLRLDSTSVTLNSGKSLGFTVQAEYEDGHIEDVTELASYLSSDEEIANAEAGVLEAKKVGIATISIDYQGAMGAPVTESLLVMVVNLNPYDRVQAEDFSDMSGVQVEDSSDEDGTKNVGYIENGDWLKYTSVDFSLGAKSFDARIASIYGGGKIEIHLDRTDGTMIGSIDIESTNGWQNYVTKSCDISEATGVHDVYLVFTGSLNINWWNFNRNFTAIETITLNKETLEMIVGQKEVLNAIVTPDHAELKDVLWISSNEKVASVDETGKVTALSQGNTSIFARSKDGSNRQAVCQIVVSNQTVTPPTSSPSPSPAASAKPIDSVSESPVVSPSKKPASMARVTVGKAKIKSLKKGKARQIKVKIRKVKGAVGYEVLYAQNKKFNQVKKKFLTKKTSFTVKKLKRGRTYYIKARAYKLNHKGKKVYGSYSSVRKIKIRK